MVLRSLDRSEPAFLELLASLLEVRRILVSEAVALAAERHTEEDLDAMREAAREQRVNLPDPLAFALGDLKLQRVIVRAARTVGLELLLNSIARFPEEQPELVAELYDRREESLPFYDTLVELVRARDGETARRTLRMAFDAMDADWLARHGHAPSRDLPSPAAPPNTTNTPIAPMLGERRPSRASRPSRPGRPDKKRQ
jgi:GntR family transcriptional repressor for pyruvate dehydrogenase complex